MLVYAILSTCKFGTRISISMEVSKTLKSSQVAHDSLDSSTSQHVLGMGHDDSRNPLVE